MLRGSLYTVQTLAEEKDNLEVMVSLDKTHPIFDGHFPGQPVLPGVCMMQMVRELLETFFAKKLQLQKADDIRYSAMVDPAKDEKLRIQIEFSKPDNLIKTKAMILKMDDAVCCKMKATFQIVLP